MPFVGVRNRRMMGKRRLMQEALFPEFASTWQNPTIQCRVIDLFVDQLDLRALLRRRSSDGSTCLSSRDAAEDLSLRLSQSHPVEPAARTESQRNLELMWLTGRLMPDFKTIADFRRQKRAAIAVALPQFVGSPAVRTFYADGAHRDDGRFKAVKIVESTMAKVASALSRRRPASRASPWPWIAPTGEDGDGPRQDSPP